MNQISLKNIDYSYGNNTVFENFNACFPFGKTSVIMSDSGRGKTTLLYLIARLINPLSGNITYPVNNPSFSMVFQDLRLIDNLSVYANIKFACNDLNGTDIDSCLSSLGLSGMGCKKIRHLSGGEKQRVAIARALLADYDILLLDEPFTGLDDNIKKDVIDYIKSRTVNKTVLLVTHDKSEALMFDASVFSL